MNSKRYTKEYIGHTTPRCKDDAYEKEGNDIA